MRARRAGGRAGRPAECPHTTTLGAWRRLPYSSAASSFLSEPLLPAHRLGRRGRARGTRRDARQALDQARVQGARRFGPRGSDDGPDDARRAGHAGQGRRDLFEGATARSSPISPCRRSPRSACTRSSSRVAKDRLAGPGVKVASVATAFPSGPVAPPRSRWPRRARSSSSAPTRWTWSSIAAPSSGRLPRRCTTISCCVREVCGDAHLKVILETGELGTYDNVRRASLIAIAAGADFIKTSTGKVDPLQRRCP